jgi:hypothetical protein
MNRRLRPDERVVVSVTAPFFGTVFAIDGDLAWIEREDNHRPEQHHIDHLIASEGERGKGASSHRTPRRAPAKKTQRT